MQSITEIIHREVNKKNKFATHFITIQNYLTNNLWILDEINYQLLYQSYVHGLSHIVRVVILATLIAASQKINKKDFTLLLFAAKYHDIGRLNDWIDCYHGFRS